MISAPFLMQLLAALSMLSSMGSFGDPETSPKRRGGRSEEEVLLLLQVPNVSARHGNANLILNESSGGLQVLWQALKSKDGWVEDAVLSAFEDVGMKLLPLMEVGVKSGEKWQQSAAAACLRLLVKEKPSDPVDGEEEELSNEDKESGGELHKEVVDTCPPCSFSEHGQTLLNIVLPLLDNNDLQLRRETIDSLGALLRRLSPPAPDESDEAEPLPQNARNHERCQSEHWFRTLIAELINLVADDVQVRQAAAKQLRRIDYLLSLAQRTALAKLLAVEKDNTTACLLAGAAKVVPEQVAGNVPVLLRLLAEGGDACMDVPFAALLASAGADGLGPLAEMLNHPKPDVRVRVAQTLVELAARGVVLEPGLAAAALSEDRNVRGELFSLLATEQGRNALKSLVTSRTPRLRAYALFGFLGGPGTNVELASAVQMARSDASPVVGFGASLVEAVQARSLRPEQDWPKLAKILCDGLSSPDKETALFLHGMLPRLLREASSAQGVSLRACALQAPDPEVRLEAAKTLLDANLPKETPSDGVERSLINDPSPEFRAIGLALEMRRGALEPSDLALALSFSSGRVMEARLVGLQALGVLGKGASEAIDLLKTALHDPDGVVRMAAARALLLSQQKDGVKIDDDEVTKVVGLALESGSEKEQEEALMMVPILGTPEPVLPIVAKFLEKPDSWLAYVAFRTFESLGPKAATVRPMLAKLSRYDRDWKVRQAALKVLMLWDEVSNSTDGQTVDSSDLSERALIAAEPCLAELGPKARGAYAKLTLEEKTAVADALERCADTMAYIRILEGFSPSLQRQFSEVSEMVFSEMLKERSKEDMVVRTRRFFMPADLEWMEVDNPLVVERPRKVRMGAVHLGGLLGLLSLLDSPERGSFVSELEIDLLSDDHVGSSEFEIRQLETDLEGLAEKRADLAERVTKAMGPSQKKRAKTIDSLFGKSPPPHPISGWTAIEITWQILEVLVELDKHPPKFSVSNGEEGAKQSPDAESPYQSIALRRLYAGSGSFDLSEAGRVNLEIDLRGQSVLDALVRELSVHPCFRSIAVDARIEMGAWPVRKPDKATEKAVRALLSLDVQCAQPVCRGGAQLHKVQPREGAAEACDDARLSPGARAEIIAHFRGNSGEMHLDEETNNPSPKRLSAESESNGPPEVPAFTQEPDPRSVPLSEWVVADGDNRVRVDKAQLGLELSDLGNIGREARVMPNFVRESGTYRGFKLIGIKPDSIYRALGFKSGDVLLKANDMELNSPTLAREFLNKLKTAIISTDKLQTAPLVTIEIMRQGQPMTLTIIIEEGVYKGPMSPESPK